MSSRATASLHAEVDQPIALRPPDVSPAPGRHGNRKRHRHGCLKRLVDAYEKALIEMALAAAGGCQRDAARVLGILPSTLHQKLRRHGIPTARLDSRPVESAQPTSRPLGILERPVDRG